MGGQERLDSRSPAQQEAQQGAWAATCATRLAGERAKSSNVNPTWR